MIPVLGVPILTRPELLDAMLASVDVEVGRTIIVDNGGVTDREAIRPGWNLGVAASWNLIIKASPLAPWWAIVNFDVVFAPGDLERLAEHMENVGGLAMLGEMHAFGVDAATIERVGFFDENFHPGYCEDVDFKRRCRLAQVSVATLPAGLTHHTSSTIAEPRYQQHNSRTYLENRAYYDQKWGGAESFDTPFGAGGHVGDWRLSLDRLRRLAWT